MFVCGCAYAVCLRSGMDDCYTLRQVDSLPNIWHESQNILRIRPTNSARLDVGYDNCVNGLGPNMA